MTPQAAHRLFGWQHAFDQSGTVVVAAVLGTVLAVTPVTFLALQAAGKLSAELRRDLWRRYLSWLMLVPLLLAPILVGAFWAMLATGALSLLCYREFSRATGVFREKLISVTVVLGILGLTFASIDHWYRLFVALTPLTVVAVAMVGLLPDQPKGYIQRVGLGVFGFVLFGTCLMHVAYLANDPRYRAYLLFLLFAVELNDVAAYASGKSFGRQKLAPNTSPKKTLGGALGAIAGTTVVSVLLGRLVFAETPIAEPLNLAVMGVCISVLGQLGDLVLSAIKRDIGVKDLGATIPGHGGLLDRFDSLLLVAPAYFHYLNYFLQLAANETPHVFTGQ